MLYSIFSLRGNETETKKPTHQKETKPFSARSLNRTGVVPATRGYTNHYTIRAVIDEREMLIEKHIPTNNPDGWNYYRTLIHLGQGPSQFHFSKVNILPTCSLLWPVLQQRTRRPSIYHPLSDIAASINNPRQNSGIQTQSSSIYPCHRTAATIPTTLNAVKPSTSPDLIPRLAIPTSTHSLNPTKGPPKSPISTPAFSSPNIYNRPPRRHPTPLHHVST